MHYHLPVDRILSLDIRSKTLAYAVLDGPFHLADFGVSRSTYLGFQRGRLENLIGKFQPHVIVLRKVSRGGKRDSPAVQTAIKSIRSKARSLSVPAVSVDQHLIDQTFRPYGKPTKYNIALLLSSCFPSLNWYVPPKRKIWMPEDRRMQYFVHGSSNLTVSGLSRNFEQVSVTRSWTDANSAYGDWETDRRMIQALA